jgi:translation initiation factor IF-3
MNGDLRGVPRVRLTDSNGRVLGVMTLAEALRAAMKAGRDLVEVNPNSDPPTCALLRYKYEVRTAAALARRGSVDDPE